jgi:hypothetical protein
MRVFAAIDSKRISPEKAQELMKMFQCCVAPKNEDSASS